MSCDTPPDSLCSLKRSLQPCHVALNGIVPPSSTSLVKKENNARKTFESALAKKKKEKILNSTFPKLNNAKGVLKSRELTAEKVSRIKRDLKGSGGSERRGGQGERGLKERLRPSTKALSSAIKKEHLFKKYNSTNAAPNTPNKNINSSCNLVDKFNRKLRRAQSNGTHNNGTKHALYNEKDRGKDFRSQQHFTFVSYTIRLLDLRLVHLEAILFNPNVKNNLAFDNSFLLQHSGRNRGHGVD